MLYMIFSMDDQTGSNPADINWFGSHTGKDPTIMINKSNWALVVT